MERRDFLSIAATLMFSPAALPQRVESPEPEDVLQNWYRLMLALVRHTATYSPPVAARAFAYVGIAAYEAVASGQESLQTLVGQLRDMPEIPARTLEEYDEAIVLHGVMANALMHFFSNTGPSGKRAISLLNDRLGAKLAANKSPTVVSRSLAYGVMLENIIHEWSLSDGGDSVVNMGFPAEYLPEEGPENWVPTSNIVLQQAPLLPDWGNNRTFVLASASACQIPPPPSYSEHPESAFYQEAIEVYETSRTLTSEQADIARFWSDDPMLSPTPPGHWVAITLEIIQHQNMTISESVNALSRLGIGMSDAFIACWHSKYTYNLVRPVTYINRIIDPAWQTLVDTPPFPEYPSGHSTQSGAAAAVLTGIFGDQVSFVDRTHEDENLPARSFNNFTAAAEEAALSRLYGGIHFRSAIERGLEQGRCVAEHVNQLKTL